jgi:glycosyltransferase involved in cell wall biosynthesis
MPISILEAMAGGNAILSTTVGSIPEVVGDEGGVLVEPGDADALYDAATDLVTSPDRVTAMGRRNRTQVEERYHWESVTESLCSVYEQLTRR